MYDKYNKQAKYTHKGITLLCDASPLKKMITLQVCYQTQVTNPDGNFEPDK